MVFIKIILAKEAILARLSDNYRTLVVVNRGGLLLFFRWLRSVKKKLIILLKSWIGLLVIFSPCKYFVG